MKKNIDSQQNAHINCLQPMCFSLHNRNNKWWMDAYVLSMTPTHQYSECMAIHGQSSRCMCVVLPLASKSDHVSHCPCCKHSSQVPRERRVYAMMKERWDSLYQYI